MNFSSDAGLPTPQLPHPILICALALLLPLNASAAIYKSVSPDGHVVYSDEPQSGATEIKVAPSPVAPSGASITHGPVPLPAEPVASLPPAEPPVAGSAPATTPVPVQAQDPATFAGYTRFAITQPQDDSSVRVNNGDVQVDMALEPPLFVPAGHTIALLLDGKPAAAGQTTATVILPNIDRGTHLLQAEVVDAHGEVLATSEGVTFTLQRFSSGSAGVNNPLLVPSAPMVGRPSALIAPRAPQ